MRVKPEQQLKTIWYLNWVLVFCAGIVFWVLMIFFVNEIIYSICLGAWFVILIPVLFWIPKAYNIVEYFIENDSVKMQAGVVWKKNVIVPYSKVTNLEITSGPMQRKFGVGTIHMQTAGYGGQQGQKPELKINGIKETFNIRDIILEHIGSYRKNIEAVRDTDRESRFQGKEILTDGELPVLKDILSELKEISKKLEK